MKNSILVLFLLIFTVNFNAQNRQVSVEGKVIDKKTQAVLPFVNVVLKNEKDSSFVAGTITGENGVFLLENISPKTYILTVYTSLYKKKMMNVFVGESSPFLNLGKIELEDLLTDLEEITVVGKQDAVNSKMDKKSYSTEENATQSGGSLLQTLENLPGITVQDNKVQLRGNDKVIILIDGKQSALTGVGGQSGLGNISASMIERIEIINNPSSKFDANGNAGIINIILKKNTKTGFNGKVGLASGLGALWVKKKNLETVNPQYQFTPKLNPSISLNYRKEKVNVFLQLDNLYTQTLNKNEFVSRTYSDGMIINQQTRRNRNTNFFNSKLGMDWYLNPRNQLTFAATFGSEKIIDHGEQPFFDGKTSERLRMWQFLEDELKTTIIGNLAFQHDFKAKGRTLNTSLNYTFHRENEKYFFMNILPTYTGFDSFKLLSDEKIGDFNLDYVQPLKFGKLETGIKTRLRSIPTNMQFFAGQNSPLDTNAGGLATYNELIPAAYGTYFFDKSKWEGELGLRVEYVQLNYYVNPNHTTYKSSGYDYLQPFPNFRLGYKQSEKTKFVLFLNRRVDRPNEVDIRIFPKYDDAEIIKVGNPSLQPQFTNSAELSWKQTLKKGYFYATIYAKQIDATITRISSTVDSSKLIYAVFQNAGKSFQTGIEAFYSQTVNEVFSFNVSSTVYSSTISAFSVVNLYPKPKLYESTAQQTIAGNLKINGKLQFKKSVDLQFSAIYLSPEIIPQGNIGQRFTFNCVVNKKIQKGKGLLFINASDLFNTMNIKRTITGTNFTYVATDYYETQVIRIGYNHSF
jgi:outer membrane receptor protein involved in Fe transport